MFGKFFASAFTGSMMAAGPEVFAVWGYVIAHTVDSTVELNPKLLAAVIGSDESRMQAAINELCSPDPRSRSKNDGGCRLIREGEYQYRVPNHEKYRSIRDEDGRREYNRLKQQEHRAKKAMSNGASMTVNDSQACQPKQKQKQKQENIEATPLVVLPLAKRLPACPTDEIVSMYHAKLPMLPRVEVVNEGRKRALSARWRQVVADPDIAKSEKPRDEGVEWFAWYFDHAAKSPFLTGKAKNWRADFDFLINPQKFVKVVEGHYHKEQA